MKPYSFLCSARQRSERWSGADPLPPEADQIIRECGDLAAAISQIGASLSDISPAEWRDTQALKNADITAIEDRLPLARISHRADGSRAPDGGR